MVRRASLLDLARPACFIASNDPHGFAPGAPGACGDDCDDTNPAAHPGGTEVCDGADNDCNGIVDDAFVYSPTGKQAVQVTEDFFDVNNGGITYNGSFYATSFSGREEMFSPAVTYMKGLKPNGKVSSMLPESGTMWRYSIAEAWYSVFMK